MVYNHTFCLVSRVLVAYKVIESVGRMIRLRLHFLTLPPWLHFLGLTVFSGRHPLGCILRRLDFLQAYTLSLPRVHIAAYEIIVRTLLP